MALVSISEAAKLVRRNRSTIYRDIERGRISKTVSPEGETQIETSELLRAYGRLHSEDEMDEPSRERMRIAILEERTRALERALALEAELRKVKDQVTHELRARLADKENVIKVLESKVLFLEYDKQVESSEQDAATTLQPEDQKAHGREQQGHEQQSQEQSDDFQPVHAEQGPRGFHELQGARPSAEQRMPKRGWWARFLKKR
jgi:IS30 family transposase